MSEEASLDTGELLGGRPPMSNKYDAVRKRQQRRCAKKKAMKGNDEASTVDTDDSSSRNDISRIYAIKELANLTSSEEEKNECLDALRSFAGLAGLKRRPSNSSSYSQSDSFIQMDSSLSSED